MLKMKSRPVIESQTEYRSLTFNLIKWTLICFAIMNILSSIWVGIYLEISVKEAIDETPDVDGNYLYGDRRTSAKVWKGFIIAFLVIIDLINLVAIVGTLKESYNIAMIYGMVLMAYSIFTAVNDYTRGSYSAWIVPFCVAVLAFAFAHKIRIEVKQPTVYTSAAPA